MKYNATTFTPIYLNAKKYLLLLVLLCSVALTQKSYAQGCTTVMLSYSEGFEGIATAGLLPTCTYGSPGVGTVITSTPSYKIPHSGNDYLSMPSTFGLSATNPNLFLTRAFALHAGTTYNFTYWYLAQTSGWNMYALLDTLPSNLVTTVFTTDPREFSLTNTYIPTYTLASGSFTPNKTGIYYLGIATYNSNSSADPINIDDINVNIATNATGTPVVGLSGPSTICSGVGFNIHDSVNLWKTGIHYQWQSSPAGANTFVNINDTFSYLNTSITSATDYRLIATNLSNNQSTTSATFSVSLTPTYICNACQPANGTNLGGGGNSPLIDSVRIVNTTLQNQSYTAIPNAYMMYPASGNTTTNLYRGSTYTVQVRTNTMGSNAECYLLIGTTWTPYTMSTNPLDYTSTVTFQIGTGAALGPAILRIRTGNTGGQCNTGTTGETEDYIVNIVPAPFNDLGTTAVLQPSGGSSVCANTTFNVSATVTNTGTASQTNFLVGATYDGNSTPIYGTYTGTLAAGASATFLIGTMTIPTGGSYLLKVYSALSNDQNHPNDTSYSVVNISPLPADPIVMSDTVCSGDNAVIGVVPVTGNQYNWYNAPSGGAVVYTGTSQTFPNLTNNTTYYVSASTPGLAFSQAVGTTGVALAPGCSGGIMYNLTPNTNLTIDSWQVYFNDLGLQPVSIYYRQGTYQGNQTTPSNWYFLGSTSVNVTNTSNPYTVNLHIPFNLTNGTTYAIYMVYDGQNTSVTTAGAATVTGSDMTVAVGAPSTLNSVPAGGASLCGFFNNVNNASQFTFDGTIYYHIGGSDCESNRVPVTAAVGLKPVVNLGPNDTACYTPNLIVDAGNPGAKYLWNTGDTTQRIHVDSTGTFYVTVTKYCTTVSTPKTVTVLPQPYVLGINYTRQNNTTYAFSAAGARNVDGYTWNFGDGTGSNLANPVHTYANNYPYHISLIVNNNCGYDTLTKQIPTGITNVNQKSGNINLYPNPANTTVTVNALDNLELKDIVIVNAIGQEVYHTTATNSKTQNIDISMLPAGNYILRAGTTEGIINKLFEVMHQ